MTKAEKLFHQIAQALPDVKEGKMFGALCIKTPNGKSAAMLWKEDLVVKLDAVTAHEALELHGAQCFNPMGNRAMKEWVQIPFTHTKRWKEFTEISVEIVRKIKK